MPVQDFTDEEAGWMIQFTGNLSHDIAAVKAQVNIPISSLKTVRVAAVDSKIASTQSALDAVSDAYDLAKTVEQSRLQGIIDRLNIFKTKLQNTPE